MRARFERWLYLRRFRRTYGAAALRLAEMRPTGWYVVRRR